MSNTIFVTAVIKPLPGKIDEVLKTIKPYSDYVQANEPGVLQYQFFQRTNDDGSEDIVFIEQYKDAAALEVHKNSDASAALNKEAAESGLLAGPIEIKVLKPLGGIGFRG